MNKTDFYVKVKKNYIERPFDKRLFCTFKASKNS